MTSKQQTCHHHASNRTSNYEQHFPIRVSDIFRSFLVDIHRITVKYSVFKLRLLKQIRIKKGQNWEVLTISNVKGNKVFSLVAIHNSVLFFISYFTIKINQTFKFFLFIRHVYQNQISQRYFFELTATHTRNSISNVLDQFLDNCVFLLSFSTV